MAEETRNAQIVVPWCMVSATLLNGAIGWGMLQPKTAIPNLAIIITSIVAGLVGLINIGSSTAFNAVISLSVSTLYASYIITESLLLWRRCTGAIRPYQKHPFPINTADDGENNASNQLIWGPFHLPGIIGIAVNMFAVAFGIIIFFFSFWPVATPVTPATMNYSVVMTAAVVIFAILYYIIYARNVYTGPIVEVTPWESASEPKEKIDLGTAM
ncbi:MAG: hypothetical protein Q9213_005543 [Squamulea squamosa]